METKQATEVEELDEKQEAPGDEFVTVAIGASAGGLEALTELIRALPPTTGMAFVLIQHMDPTHHSLLRDLVAKETSMAALEVTDGMRVEPNHVYVIPPNATMSIANRVLHLNPREDAFATRMTVDHFMRSLAEDQGSRSAGVILSGSGSDGTLGLAEIQAQGGVTFAQDESTARHDGMPRSAIASGAVDFVLPPKGIDAGIGADRAEPFQWTCGKRRRRRSWRRASSNLFNFPTFAEELRAGFYVLPAHDDSAADSTANGGS